MEFHPIILHVIFALRPVGREICTSYSILGLPHHSHCSTFVFGRLKKLHTIHKPPHHSFFVWLGFYLSKQPTKCCFTSSGSRSQLHFCFPSLTVLWSPRVHATFCGDALFQHKRFKASEQVPRGKFLPARIKRQRAGMAESVGSQPVAEAWMHSHKGIIILSGLGFINELSRFQALFLRCLAGGHSLRL